MLCEIPLPGCTDELPAHIAAFAAEGLRRAKRIDCFDFVPSSAVAVYRALAVLPPARFCEWGCGMGINTGIAELLGHQACGIELDPRLADAARTLLADFGLQSVVLTGSYFELDCQADVYFTYCWPSQMSEVERHFFTQSPADARLLICHGAEDVRCKIKDEQRR